MIDLKKKYTFKVCNNLTKAVRTKYFGLIKIIIKEYFEFNFEILYSFYSEKNKKYILRVTTLMFKKVENECIIVPKPIFLKLFL
jgi:hypothetical protein